MNTAGNVDKALDDAFQLLDQVVNTGPLQSLLKASDFRASYQRINRDLHNAFQILATGVVLLVGLA